MAEQTFNEALHGNEVVEAILDRLRNKLRMDCYLNPNMAYDYFTAEISIKLTLHDMGMDVKTEADVQATHGEEPHDDAYVREVTDVLDIDPQPPNVVREQTGQPVPVLSRNAQGKTEIRRVQYSRPSAKAAAKRAAKGATVVLCAFLLSHAARGQGTQPTLPANAPKAAPVPPAGNPAAMSSTEAIAVQATMQQLDQAVQQLRAIEADMARAHPGFHLNERTGSLDKNEAPPTIPDPTKQPAKPAGK